jgi:Phytanoyl-CoA dioxygenase (PhyH)
MGSSDIREVADDEVTYFREHGWVKLDQLISRELASRLLEQAKAYMGANGDEHVGRPGVDAIDAPWTDRHNVVEEDECFASVGMSPKMGANAQRLMRRTIGVLMAGDMLAVKPGLKHGLPSTVPTPFHQDAPNEPIDRNGFVSFWIALDHVTPEMGSMRFVDCSHRLGLLGCTGTDLFGVYPELSELPLTEPLEFKPGDATAHSLYMIHGTGVNETSSPRWAVVVRYFAEDVLFTGGIPWSKSMLAKRAEGVLSPGDRFTDSICPKVYG